MIIGLFGDVRSGKTVSAVKLLWGLYKGGYRVYSNMSLKFPYTPLSTDYLINIVEGIETPDENAVYFIDEITLILDSRSSGTSKINRIISYFLLQSGKIGRDKDIGTYVIYTSQYPDLIDKRLWLTTNIKISCMKQKFYDKTVIMQYWYIKKTLHILTKIEFIIADDYFKYYDTKQVIRIEKTKYDK